MHVLRDFHTAKKKSYIYFRARPLFAFEIRGGGGSAGGLKTEEQG